MATLPLCGWHHRGELVYPLTGREMKVVYGPSLALHKREFKVTYETERQLLAMTDESLSKRSAA